MLFLLVVLSGSISIEGIEEAINGSRETCMMMVISAEVEELEMTWKDWREREREGESVEWRSHSCRRIPWNNEREWWSDFTGHLKHAERQRRQSYICLSNDRSMRCVRYRLSFAIVIRFLSIETSIHQSSSPFVGSFEAWEAERRNRKVKWREAWIKGENKKQ